MQEKNNTNLERMRELIEQLTEADIAYYKNDAPIMTDLEYDRLTEELAALEHDTGLVLSGSPTQKVSGEILENLAEVRHTKPMLSAGKTKSIEDLIRFAAGRAVLLSWKMDGLTLVLRYEYGKLKQAITRGREGKANMIIPQIADNKTQSNTYMLPMTCPCCGKPLTVKYTSGGTRQLYCGNPHCAAKLVQKFTHFCEKTRMNIEGLSATTLEKLIGHGWVRNFGDLYELEQHREDIVRTEGFGERSFDRLQAAIEKSRRCTLAKFIAGLGIPMVGRHAGRDLDRYFHGSWAEFEAAILNGFDFTQLPDFGETMHNNIYTWYADAQEAKLWRPLLRKIQFETKENLTMETTMNNPFAGKTVVATGKLEHYTRDGIQEKLISLGAHPSGAVSKKTDYLIVGEKAGSKLTKAQQLGVKTLTEQEFEDMLA